MSPRIERRNYGRGHGYKIDGHKVPGVTTILGGSMPKPALVKWAADTTAAAAVDRWDELAELPPTKRLYELQGARFAVTKAASLRGNQIHEMGQRLAHGLPVDVPDEHVGPVEAYARFLDEWQFDFIGTEAPVGSTQFGYAGTLDAIASSPKIAGGVPIMLDLKTGKGVYDETGLQLAAYARCDLWQPNGKDSETQLPAIDGLYVAHILPDAVRLRPVIEDTDRLMLTFRYLLTTYRWIEARKSDPVIGADLELGAL